MSRFLSSLRSASVSSVSKILGNNYQLGHLAKLLVAVPDLTQASDLYGNALNMNVSEPQPVPEHGVTVVFIHPKLTDRPVLELLHPLGDNSPISKFLQRNPAGGLHHICFETQQDLTLEIQRLQKEKIRSLDPVPKLGAHGNPVVFLHPKDMNGVLIELEQIP